MKPGPVTDKEWGRIWANAFLDLQSRKLLEDSPRDAASAFFKEKHLIVFNPDAGCAKMAYDALEALAHIRLTELRDGNNLSHGDIVTALGVLEGNQWILKKSGVVIYTFTQNINGALNPAQALRRIHWGRVYAEAILDEPKFKELLKRDPALAVEEFDARPHPNKLPHNANAPIFEIPDDTELHADIVSKGVTDPNLTNLSNLRGILEQIRGGLPSMYEASVRVCLSC